MARIRRTTCGVAFRCPGCGDVHAIPVGPEGWSWDGSLEAPTITPSINVTSGHHTPHWKPGDGCWCGNGCGYECYRCHSTVTGGRITFCGDSTHALSRQTVELPLLPPDP